MKVRIKNNAANIITFLNLTLGCLALLFIIQSEFLLATILILLGTFLDRFDGRLARKFATTSDFGKELDSLADLVTFGVAPAFLIWSLILCNLWFGSTIAVIYILAGAFRLARYNSMEFDNVYIGVPITIAGGLMAILSLVYIKYSINVFLVSILIMILSYSMVSTKIKVVKR